MDELAEFDTVIIEELNAFQAIVLQTMQENIAKFNVKASLELLQSIEALMLSGNTGIHTLRILFAKYGTATEMQKKYLAKKAGISDLEKWVENLGINKFKFVPGYANGKIPTESIAINRIAWGVKMTRKLNRNPQYRKPWFYKPFYSELGALYDRISARATEQAADSIYRTISGTIKNR